MSAGKFKFLISFLILAVLLVSIVAMVPSLRYQVKNFILPGHRKIITKSIGLLSSEGPSILVFKIKSGANLLVEIYETNAEGLPMRSLGKIVLDNQNDGYFNFKGNATNLVLSDIDQDGFIEVIAPSFDESHQSRLNIFKYNPVSSTFERIDSGTLESLLRD